jgi:hypothetical protein
MGQNSCALNITNKIYNIKFMKKRKKKLYRLYIFQIFIIQTRILFRESQTL